ncbi:cyclic nucleotide-binding domain-containing protein [Yoonia sediminilitoris]|uniref:Cyclic nucleotide-binding domain-containing protein n=1 Tax=Yoonia sediminilitoris TaxID=1286148 RepID=A0A2T6K848_9RHOB|nr:cyclic nucleotide-binding domain-containing protein [Yoonia sediminilitoris]PUB10909.1 hypothetical protein C8N45_11682 [Yoonia sediminilitoris]RCW90584.1 hypothetical protein DFP92_11682 [Yoonia sediminilitoris]
MESIFQSVSLSSFLIIGAVGTYVIGFLCRDQLYLRLLIVMGSFFYTTYYWIVPTEPLWDAMIGAILVGTASLQGAIQIIWSRTMISTPQDTRQVLDLLGDIEPGLFRRLMRMGDRYTVTETTELTTEGAKPDSLWLLLDGWVELRRHGQAPIKIYGPCFVGEIAWLTGGNASASVEVKPGADLVRWQHGSLRRGLRRNHRLELALEALIAQDLARKLSYSTPITSQTEIM